MDQLETATAAQPTLPGALRLLGERLRAVRRERGLSQEAVAKPEFTKSYVSAVERGKARPSLKALELMAARLGVRTSELLALPLPDSGPDGPPLQVAEVALTLDAARWAMETGRAQASLEQLDALEAAYGDTLEARPDLRAQALVLRGQARLALGTPDFAHDSFQEALLQVEGEDPTGGQAEAIMLLVGESYTCQGLFDLALPLLERVQAAVAAGTVENPAVPAQLADLLGQAYRALGRPDQALAVYQAALQTAAADLAGQAARYGDASRTAQTAHRWPQAGRYALEAEGIGQAEENLCLYTAMQQELARLYAARGEARPALALLQQAEALLRAGGNQAALSAVQQQAATLALAGGDVAEARRYAAEALHLAESQAQATGLDGIWPTMVRAQQVAGQVAEMTGDRERADVLFQQALSTAQAQGSGPLVREIAQTYAEILEARGDHAQAVPYYRTALQARPRPSG